MADLTDDVLDDPDALTPVQEFDDVWMKRDDLFGLFGVRGGKVRTCYTLSVGAPGLITAGSRSSPQVNIVAHIARGLGVPCRVHVPTGELLPELVAARDAGAEVVQQYPGYNTVIVSRAHHDATASGWTEIPFGMQCHAAVTMTSRQVANIPTGVRRLVVPVGSGMSLAGIVRGLRDAKRRIPILGVIVGADPVRRLDAYAPADWRSDVTLTRSERRYDAPEPDSVFHGVQLDPIYEAKCIRHVRAGDCLWVVGIRQTAG